MDIKGFADLSKRRQLTQIKNSYWRLKKIYNQALELTHEARGGIKTLNLDKHPVLKVSYQRLDGWETANITRNVRLAAELKQYNEEMQRTLKTLTKDIGQIARNLSASQQSAVDLSHMVAVFFNHNYTHNPAKVFIRFRKDTIEAYHWPVEKNWGDFRKPCIHSGLQMRQEMVFQTKNQPNSVDQCLPFKEWLTLQSAK